MGVTACATGTGRLQPTPCGPAPATGGQVTACATGTGRLQPRDTRTFASSPGPSQPALPVLVGCNCSSWLSCLAVMRPSQPALPVLARHVAAVPPLELECYATVTACATGTGRLQLGWQSSGYSKASQSQPALPVLVGCNSHKLRDKQLRSQPAKSQIEFCLKMAVICERC